MQEVSGSIPLFSTKKALYFVGSMVLFFLLKPIFGGCVASPAPFSGFCRRFRYTPNVWRYTVFKLESDLNLPFGKNGKFLFQLGYTPVVSDMKKIVQKTAALSFSKWALAVWDMDTATLYMVKYDRSH